MGNKEKEVLELLKKIGQSKEEVLNTIAIEVDNKVKFVFDLLNKFRYSKQELLILLGLFISGEQLDFILDSLIEKNFIYKGIDQKYGAIRRPFAVAKLERNRQGQYFVTVNEEDYIIPEAKLHGAFPGDTITVDCTKNIVVGIQNRSNHNLVCDVVIKNNKLALVPFNAPYPIEVLIHDYFLTNLFEGDRVCIQLSDEVCVSNQVKGVSIEKLGRADDQFADEISIAISRGFATGFPEPVLEEAAQFSDDIKPEQKEGRVDLTEEQAFTIDSIHTKDMDDSLIVKENSDGTINLKVNISDVIAVVGVNSKLFAEALKRGTSVYIGDYVDPMFPIEISGGICSLKEGKERLTITCDMTFDSQGNVIKYDIYPSVIKSKKKMTYEDLNKFMQTGEIDDSYYDFFESIDALKKLSDRLTRNRKAKGALEFVNDNPEPRKNNETGEVEYRTESSGESEKWIENSMVSANEAIALEFIKNTLPLIFRCHEDPESFKIEKAKGILQKLNVDVRGLNGEGGRKQLQSILKQYSGNKEWGPIISYIILRCMPIAYYTTENKGHWALASDGYCHFTSPIRRLADLIVCLLIHIYIFKEKIEIDLDDLLSQLDNIAKYCTYKSRQADECERDFAKLCSSRFIDDHMGEEMEVQIMDVKNNYVEVKITENGLRGRLSIKSGILQGSSLNLPSKQIVLPHKTGVIMLGDYMIVRPIKNDRNKGGVVFEGVEFVQRHPKQRQRKQRQKKGN
jgi:ribonuclease R